MAGCRGQVSMEYLFIMGFAVLITIPLILVYYTQTSQLGDETASASAERLVNQVADAADSVYYLGAPSSRSLLVEVPEGAQSLQLSESTISLTLSSSTGTYAQVAEAATNLTGGFTVTPGPHTIMLTALPDNRVNISER